MTNDLLRNYQAAKPNSQEIDSLSDFLTFREKLYAIVPFGWGAIALFLAGGRNQTFSGLYRFLSFSLGSAGLSILILVNSSLGQVFANILLILGINLFVLSNDLFKEGVDKNLTIHFLNAGYLGLALYLYVMTLYPTWFPASNSLWQVIVVSAPKSALMLTLCLFFQNIGYYTLGQFAFGSSSVKKWFTSNKNLLNLGFINQNQTNKINLLFISLVIIGSLTRLIEIFLGGSIIYIAATVIPTSISSFVSQFSVLYPIGWLYGTAIILSTEKKANKFIGLTTFVIISFELVFQFFSGSKGRFFTQIIIPLSAVYLLVKKKVGVHIVIIGFGLAFTSWLVLYPALVIYRSELAQLSDSSAPLLNTMNVAFQTLINLSWNDYLQIVLRPLNQSRIPEQNLALTSIIHTNLHIQGAEENLWERLMFFWLPRALWPAKPANLSTNLIGRLSGRLNPEDYTTSVLTTGSGEVFIYYGFAGSLLMIIAGLIFRGTNDLISPFQRFSYLKVAIFISFMGLMKGIISGGFEEVITGILLQIGVLYLVLWLFKKLTT